MNFDITIFNNVSAFWNMANKLDNLLTIQKTADVRWTVFSSH